MKTIRLLGLGISLYETPPIPEPGVEVWGIQYTWKTHQLHRAFIMDDEAWITAKNNNLGRDISKEINAYEFPVYVSHPWKSLDHWAEYPLEHVVSCFPNLRHRILTKTDRGEEFTEIQGKYFLNSFCYMMALAIFEEADRIELFGIDMANMSNRAPTETWEDERACVSYWVGIAIGKGIEVVISKDSRITKPIDTKAPVLYGYEVNDELKEIRKKVLGENKELNRAITSATAQLQPNGDKIIDMTNTPLRFAVFRKEDMPDNVKPGDMVAPKGQPFAFIGNDKLDQEKI